MRHKTRPAPLHSPYWLAVRSITARVIIIWLALIFLTVFVVPLLGITVAGVSLTYWLISSVLLLGFVGLVAYYSFRMDKLESEMYRQQTNQADIDTDPSLQAGDTHENQQGRG